jgi:cytosine permease
MFEKFRVWWTLDKAAEQDSPDNPFGPLGPGQRRDAGPMLALAFGWGFLITGLFIGGLLGAGQPFWPELGWSSLLGNGVNFVVGALVGYMGYRTGCNSGLLFRLVYGNVGAAVPVLFLTVLLIFWQGITVGAFSFAWVQDFESPWFYVVAIFAGLLYTWTTYYGVQGLEKVALPAALVLVAVLLYAGWYNVNQAGGWDAFLALSRTTAAKNPLTNVQAMNIVIGSWIVGAVVMAEYTRFARQAWVAIAIPFIVLIVTQWILQFVGAMGGVVSGNFDFTVYMRSVGTAVSLFGLIAMSFALWTTGDANLYLPSIQTASVFRRPKRVMVVVCGLLHHRARHDCAADHRPGDRGLLHLQPDAVPDRAAGPVAGLEPDRGGGLRHRRGQRLVLPGVDCQRPVRPAGVHGGLRHPVRGRRRPGRPAGP